MPSKSENLSNYGFSFPNYTRIINNWELRNREKKLDTQPCDSRIP